MYAIDPRTDTLASALGKLAGKTRFIDGLVYMGEEAYEIEFDVMDTAKIALECLAIWQIENRIASPSNDGLMAIPLFYEFVYLLDHPRRLTLSKATKKCLREFFSGKYGEKEVRKILRGAEARQLIVNLYFMLVEGGYAGAEKPLRYLRDLQSEFKH